MLILRHSRRLRALALGALLMLPAGALLAHDFWIVPVLFQVEPGSSIEVLGQTGTRFPVSQSAVAPERVAEARIIGSNGDENVGDFSIRDKSLLLRHRPSQAGQVVVAVALAPASRRVTPAGLQRYIALEGAPELAQRYEREGRYPGTDSVTQRSQKSAKTVMEVGQHGPRAFGQPAGHLLELVPVGDPASVRPGGSLEVRVLYRGRPLPNAALRAGLAVADSSAPRADTTLVSDAGGVVRLAVPTSGLWNLRLLHAAPAPDTAGEWEVLFATFVFNVDHRTP